MQQLSSHEIDQVTGGSLLSLLGAGGSLVQSGANSASQLVDDIASLIPITQNFSTIISSAVKLVGWFGGNFAALFNGK